MKTITNISFFLLLVTFLLGQIVRWEFLGGQVVVRPNDIFALVLGIYGWLNLKKDVLLKPLLFFFGAMILSLLVNIFNYSPTQLLISSSYLIRFILYSGLYFTFKKFEIKNIYLIFIFLTVSILGLIQYHFSPDVSYLAAYNWDDHYYRLVSTFLDPGFTGAILVIGLVFIFNLKLVLFPILYLAFALTYSRAAFLMFIISFTTIAYFKKSWQIFIFSVLLMGLTLLILPNVGGEGTKLSRETSSWARIENWKQSLEIFAKNPIFGVGFDTYRYATKSSLVSHAGAGADSSLFFVLATTGLVGFLSYLYLLKTIWIMGRNNLIFSASATGLFINSFFNNTLFYPYTMILIWLLLAKTSNSK